MVVPQPQHNSLSTDNIVRGQWCGLTSKDFRKALRPQGEGIVELSHCYLAFVEASKVVVMVVFGSVGWSVAIRIKAEKYIV